MGTEAPRSGGRELIQQVHTTRYGKVWIVPMFNGCEGCVGRVENHERCDATPCSNPTIAIDATQDALETYMALCVTSTLIGSE